jgi:hypothetical protein
VGLDSLAKPWNDGVQQGQLNNSIAVISQVTGYASSGGLRVAAITTYRRTWVLQFNVAGRNIVEVSKAYAWDAQKPSALQVRVPCWQHAGCSMGTNARQAVWASHWT